MSHGGTTGADYLDSVRIFSDRLAVDETGVLTIGGVSATALLARYGSPLVVGIEDTLLANFDRIRSAFEVAWHGPVGILYAIKSNNSLAFRHILSRVSAGGDCFGEGELRATLESGADPAQVALNGSNKSPELILQAVASGVTINIDCGEEVDFIAAACLATGRQARVNLRLKVLPGALSAHMGSSTQRHGDGIESVRRAKWGLSPLVAQPLLVRLLAMPEIDLLGFSVHIGHLSNQPEAFAVIADSFGTAVEELCRDTGLRPRILDLGGGWAREREPEQRMETTERVPIEAQAHAACLALARSLGSLADPALGAVPELWIEPGRYICGNAQLLLASIGSVKEDTGYRWVNVDISTNDLMRIETGSFHYHVLPASRMHAACELPQEIVGGTCFRSVIGAGRRLPILRRGDVVAVLDTGMYAEVFATQFNSVPRPAAVLVGPDSTVDLIRIRETVDDVFGHHRVPNRLAIPSKE